MPTIITKVVEDIYSKGKECSIILMAENITKEEIFVLEASKAVVVDTTCTKMVAAELWFVNDKWNLTENTIKNTQKNSKQYLIYVWWWKTSLSHQKS